MTRPKNDPLPETCGDKRGTYAGHGRHWRAGESPCGPCRTAANAYRRSRYEADPVRVLAVSRARSALVNRHRAEYDALYRAALAEAWAERGAA